MFYKNFLLRTSSIIAVSLLTTSCSLLWIDEPTETAEFDSEFGSPAELPVDHEASTVSIDKLPEKKDMETASLDKVEVLWKIPEKPVDGFILHYGYTKETLTQNIRLATTDIERYEDKEFGAVYRYILSDVPTDKPVFISLQTVDGDEISERSEVFEVTSQ